jgi:CMP-N-acetylneuraminic acid synthetase
MSYLEAAALPIKPIPIPTDAFQRIPRHGAFAMQEPLVVILARAGSKGLPGKNALAVAGRPMLSWTIDHALGATLPRRVVLSTDGEELAQIGREHGIAVVERSPSLANDTATVDAAARHAVQQMESAEGCKYRAAVILYGNVPVRPSDLTDRALARLDETGADSVQSVCHVGKHHPYWMKQLVGEGCDTLAAYEPNQVYRRQDLPPVYGLDGGIIAVRRASLFHKVPGQPHAFLGSDQRAVVTEPGEVVDVDTEIDRKFAEAVLREQLAVSF